MKVAICGGGLVGALEACYLAKRGYEVHLFEARPDPRKQDRVVINSINLALSPRGITALEKVGVAAPVVKDGIPMRARMIHSHSGQLSQIPYSKDGKAILSVDRRGLNEYLLSEAEKYQNVTLYFEHKLKSSDPNTGTLVFHNGNTYQVDFIVGADGAHSQTRRSVMRHSRVNYSQYYIPHGYKELCIPPAEAGGFRMAQNFLHIWPRNTFMMIALPNLDGSFTVTLFMPFERFEELTNPTQVLEFFEREFPDSIDLIGRERLEKDFFTNPTAPLITVKCSPLAYKHTVLLGDAAHAIVPFYGQGMNSGFEDCEVLDTFLDKYSDLGMNPAPCHFVALVLFSILYHLLHLVVETWVLCCGDFVHVFFFLFLFFFSALCSWLLPATLG
eukprot:m.185581 g.185581  ORF g.185581 m.185581 type:complete len:387 (-) comp14733_c0_seq4:1928-3088(-)